MSLYYRCHCSEVLEAPEGSEGEKALCPTCGKVVVIPKDPILVSEAEKEETKSKTASAKTFVSSMPGGVPVLPGQEVPAAEPAPFEMPPAEPVPAESWAIAPQEPAPVGPVDVGPGVAVGTGDSFEDILGVGTDAVEPAPEELLPEIPEIPVSAPPPPPAKAAAPAAPPKKAPPKKAPAPREEATAPEAVKAASKRAPIKAGAGAGAAPSKRVSQRGRSRRREPMITCPECGAQVPKLSPICEECGHRFKKGGVLKWFFILLLLLILAAGGLGAAVMYVPDKLPAFLLEPAANIGDKLRDLGVPVPQDFGRPAQTGDAVDETEEAAPAEDEETPADALDDLPVVGEEELEEDITIPTETVEPADEPDAGDITVE